MNPTDPSPVPQKSGSSGPAKAAIGCAILLVIGMAATLVLLRGCLVRVKSLVDNPAKTAAEFAVRANPNLEVIKTDDGKGEITMRDKKTGEVTTMSFSDLSQGKFAVKNAKGETVSVDSPGANGAGKVVVNGPDGSTVIGGDAMATLPPKWVPAYPSAQVQSGGMKHETKDSVSGTYSAQTKDSPGKVKDYFDSTLKADGFTTSSSTADVNGAESAVITATNDAAKRKITIMATSGKGSTDLVITYEGAK